jgi:hypothetical protein
MSFLYFVLVIGVVWWILKQVAQSTPERRIERAEELAEMFLHSFLVTQKVSFGQEQEPPEVVRMKDWYIRLKEKHKHDPAKLVQLAQDWQDFTYNLSQKSSSAYLWLETEDEEHAKELHQKGREMFLRIEEIENRFADMLGGTSRKDLETERKQKEKASLSLEKALS